MRKALSTLVAMGCLTAALSAFSVNLAPRSWKTNQKAALSASVDGGLQMAFPTWPKYVGYLYSSVSTPISGTIVVDLRVDTFNAPTFVINDNCSTRPVVRPFVGRFSQGGRKEIAFSDRWWANEPYAYTIASGSASIAVPVDRTFFTGLHWTGLGDDAAFNLAMSDPDIVGVSIGGNCLFGHGVGVSGGTANLVLTSWRTE